MNCKNCNDVITGKRYCLWMNNQKVKPKITICTMCYMHYFLRPWMFRKVEHPEYFEKRGIITPPKSSYCNNSITPFTIQ